MRSLSWNRLGAEGAAALAPALAANGALTKIDVSWNFFGPEGAKVFADALRVNGALTVANLLGNQLDRESAKLLAEVAKQKGISLCGIQRDQTTADFSYKGFNLPDVILLASDLSQAVVTGALTECNLNRNPCIGEEGEALIRKAMQERAGFKLRI